MTLAVASLTTSTTAPAPSLPPQITKNIRRSPMLRAEDNRFLTESGAGTGMGELLRRFWLPVLLSEELPEADGEPKKVVVMGEELLAFRDTPRRGRPDRPVLPAPRRQSLARPQRGMRHPLRLSRLEVRHRRPVRRHADLVSGPQRQGQDAHQGLSGARVGRHDLGLYGPGGAAARAAGAGDGAAAAGASLRHRRSGRTATGCRRWKAPSTPRTSPSRI